MATVKTNKLPVLCLCHFQSFDRLPLKPHSTPLINFTSTSIKSSLHNAGSQCLTATEPTVKCTNTPLCRYSKCKETIFSKQMWVQHGALLVALTGNGLTTYDKLAVPHVINRLWSTSRSWKLCASTLFPLIPLLLDPMLFTLNALRAFTTCVSWLFEISQNKTKTTE